jgi:alcohol dehydrogenase class IV
MTKQEAAEASCDEIQRMSIEVGIPQHLADLGIHEKDIDALADQAVLDVLYSGQPERGHP